MSKINIPNITSGFAAVEALNTHLQTIEDELNNKVLYRNNPTGEPNSMQNDLDMNGHSVLNISTWEADNLSVANLTINGELVVPSDLATSALPDQTSHAFKFLQTDGNTSSWQVPDSSEVTYSSRSVESKLDDFVSVKDYGAVGDGVTDDYNAVKLATDAVNAAGGGIVFFPKGTYLLGTPLQMKAFQKVSLVGAGQGATTIIKNNNFSASQIRFYLGENNSISDLTIDGDGYDGRGITIEDINTIVRRVTVLNSPKRAIALSGGGNAEYGYDADGKNSDSATFGTPVFFPTDCKVFDCYIENCGQTAISQKRMRNSIFRNNTVKTVYSEGITVDKCDYSLVDGNFLFDVALTSTTAFPDKVNGGYLAVGGGGIGGIGIDGSSHAKIVNNNIIGVNTNIATLTNRNRAAIKFRANLAAGFGCIVQGNHIENTKLGIWLNSDGYNNFSYVLNNNTFKTIANSSTGGLAEFGDIYIEASNDNHIARSNQRISGNLIITDLGGDNTWEDSQGFNSVKFTNVGKTGATVLDWYEEGSVTNATLYGATTAGSLTYGTNGQRIYWTRIGRQVFFNLFVNWTAKDGTQAGQLRLGGLPFVNNSSANNLPAFSVAPVGFTITGQIHAIVSQGQSYLNLYVTNNGVRTNLDSASLPSSGTLQLSGNYFV